MLLETAPLMFFGGKGGVGKTTLATATALRLSREHRVCLVSTDPAHNLGHIFGASLGDAPLRPHPYPVRHRDQPGARNRATPSAGRDLDAPLYARAPAR